MNTSATAECAFHIFFKNISKIRVTDPNIYSSLERPKKQMLPN
jgi:hypothetical protein